MALVMSSTTDSPEQMQAALEHFGQAVEKVETIQTRPGEAAPVKDPPEEGKDKPKETPASAEPPAAGKPDEAADKTADPSGVSDDKQESGKPKPKRGIEQRFSDLTKARKEAERKQEQAEHARDELAVKLAELEAQTKTPAAKPAEAAPAEAAADAKPDAEPVLANFESYEEWNAKHQEWLTAQKLSPLQAEIKALQDKIKAKEDADAQHQAEQAAEQARKPLAERWKAGEAELKAARADYDEVMEASEEAGLQASPAMHFEIFESELGVKVNFYLATHPEECKRIYEATSVGEKPTALEVGRVTRIAAREIGRIEALIAAETAVPTVPAKPSTRPSNAPPPIKPLGARAATAAKDPSAMSPAEYAKWREEHPNG